MNDVDENKIITDYHIIPTQSLVLMKSDIGSEFESWNDNRAIDILFWKGASVFVTSGGNLHFDICGPRMLPSFRMYNCSCSHQSWIEIMSLVSNKEMRLLPHDQDTCNQYLCKVGLKVSSVMLLKRKHTIQVVMNRA